MRTAVDTHDSTHMAPPATLEEAAARFADLRPAEAETTIDAFVACAIAGWRLEEATYWQRVRFRARLIRAMHRREADIIAAEAKSLPSQARVAEVNDGPA